MHLHASVAISAFHAPGAEVNITGETFVLTQEFIANTATMTGSAVARHRWGALHYVPINKASAH